LNGIQSLRRSGGKWNGGRTGVGGGRRNMDKEWKIEVFDGWEEYEEN